MNLTELINECIQIKPGNTEFALFFDGQSEWDAHIGNESEILCLGERAGEFSALGSTPAEAVSNLLETLRGVAKAADAIAEQVQEPAWTGTGLPPVGTVCEVDYCEKWCRCEVIAHFQQRKGIVAAFTVNLGDGVKALDAFGAEYFRPIRTPEQIAAEEREKQLEAMEEVAARAWRSVAPGEDMISVIVAALHSDGYRKTEAP